jgi:glucosylceramidase
VSALLVAACSLDVGGIAHIAEGSHVGDGDDADAPDPSDTKDAGNNQHIYSDAGAGDGDAEPMPTGGADAGNEYPPDPNAVAVWLSSEDQSLRLAQQADLSMSAAQSAADSLILTLDHTQVFQEIDGFGATLHDSSAALIQDKLDEPEQKTLMRRLFDAHGAHLNILRKPLGASNFASSLYTYDDTPPDLSDFSVAADGEAALPVLRAALELEPQLLVFAAPWSAPAWLKTNQALKGGGLSRNALPELAEYLVAFVRAYEQQGVPIYALSPQNEPFYSPDNAEYPTTFIDPALEADLIAKELGPRLYAQGSQVKLLVMEHNWDLADSFAGTLLARDDARNFVAGTAFHCYGGNAAQESTLHDHYPKLDVWLTECGGRDAGPEGQKGTLHDTMQLAVGSLRNWSRSVLRGPLALDTSHGPRLGGCSDCTSAVQIANDGYTELRSEFYGLAHFSKFVARGARRIASDAEGPNAQDLAHVAFVNPDDSRVLVVWNEASSYRSFNVVAAGQSFAYVLPARAVATFHFRRQHGPISLAHAEVQTSSSGVNSAPSAVIDGNPDTRWSSGVPQASGQWLQVDLGTPTAFRALTLDAGDSETDYVRSYRIEVSDDASSWREVAQGQGDAALFTVEFTPVRARYVRITSTGSATTDWWSVHELALHI